MTNDALPMKRVDSVPPNEIVVGLEFVDLRAMLQERVVEPSDSSMDVVADEVAAVAGDFEVFDSNEIVEFVEFRLEANQLD